MIVLSALLLALGRRGQRVLSGLGLLGLVVLFALRFVKPLAPGLPVAGVLMIVGGAVAFALGVVRSEPATAAALGLLCALLGARMAVQVGRVPAWWGFFTFGVPTFFAALAFYNPLSIVLPPLAAAVALTLGLARLFGLHGAGAVLPRPAALPWAVALLVFLVALFVSLSVARERRRARKGAARTRAMNDRELEKKIARDRKRLGAAPAPVSDPAPDPDPDPDPEPDPEPGPRGRGRGRDG